MPGSRLQPIRARALGYRSLLAHPDGGPFPSPFRLFTRRVREDRAARIPAAVHVDGTAGIQAVDVTEVPLMHRCISSERHKGYRCFGCSSRRPGARSFLVLRPAPFAS